jgi:hypothetical protein
MKKLTVLFFITCIPIFCLFSQTKSINGRVIAEDFDILPFVSIVINDTIEVGKTDMNGFFNLEIPHTTTKLLLLTVGMEPTTIRLNEKCNKIEVVMMNSVIYDFISLKRSEKRRKKRFKKLPEIHKRAFENGIFETARACYDRDFESY